jgi:hypothetical protein
MDKRANIDFRGNAGYGMGPTTEASGSTGQAAFVIFENAETNRSHSLEMATRRPLSLALVGKANEGASMAISSAPFVRTNTCSATIVCRYLTFNRLLLIVDTKASGFVVLSFPYSPRWRGTIDHTPLSIRRGAQGRLMLPVNPGIHLIDLRFISFATVIGVLITLVTISIYGLKRAARCRHRTKRVIATFAAIALPLIGFIAWEQTLYAGRDLGAGTTWTFDNSIAG